MSEIRPGFKVFVSAFPTYIIYLVYLKLVLLLDLINVAVWILEEECGAS